MPSSTPLPEPLTWGPFRFGEAMRLGVPRSRLRAADVSRPHHGVYNQASQFTDLVDRCGALRPLLGPYQWFSHLTAARLWGMPLPVASTVDEPLHTIALAGRSPLRRRDVVGWETADQDLPGVLMRMLPIVAPAEVWCQLAVPGGSGIDSTTGARRSLNEEWLVAVGDYVITGPRRYGQRHPLCTVEELRQALARRRGKRGAKTLTAAIGQVRAPVDSPKETQLRLRLVAHGLPEPQIQVPVWTSSGWRRADLGYPEARLLLEYQGDGHRTDRAQWLQDLTRVQQFQDAGWRVMLIGADDIDPDCTALAHRVRRALAGRTFSEAPKAP